MTKKRNVLVFSGGSYPGVQICQCLKYSLVFHPIAASSYSDHAEFIFDEYYDKLPYVYETNFIDALNSLISEYNIEFIIPTHDTIAMILMQNAEKINAVVVCSPVETTIMCRYKSKTYASLQGSSFLPKLFNKGHIPDSFPIFAKPDVGEGSRNARKIDNLIELNELWRLEDEMVVSEYLPGNEYTVDCFTNYRRELLFVNPRLRTRIQYGISARAESVVDPTEFIEIAQEVNKKIHFRGYWFIQLRRDISGKLKLLELCTRFAGSFNHSKSLGVNLPVLALSDFLGLDVTILPNKYFVTLDKSFIDRYNLRLNYSRIYIDYDDTITCNQGEAVNPYVIAYLYQCKHKRKEIILLTRHTASKNSSLLVDFNRLCLSTSLFTRIIELSWQQEKADFIDNSIPSIFIDNSFAERQKVWERCNLPTFDVCNIDCLFDWR